MAVQNLTYQLTAEFTPMEAAFKYIYTKGMSQDAALEALRTDPELSALLYPGSEDIVAFREILRHLNDAESLHDEIFFDGTEDVYLNIHARYMPIFRHKNQFFNLQYVVRGTLNEVVAGQEMTFHAGDICFIAPETEHALAVFDDETIVVNILIKRETFQSVFINLLNKDDVISDFFTRVLICSAYYPYIYCRTDIAEKLTPIVVEMITIENSQMHFRNRLLVNKLEELFIYLLEMHEYDFVTGSTLGETDKKILPVLRYIQEHYRTVTLVDTARYFNYSESYLSRLISQYAGSSFSQIVKTTRLRNAVRLLTESDLSVEEISTACGYEDRSHFHKTFRKEFGMTPVQYRNSHRGDRETSRQGTI